MSIFITFAFEWDVRRTCSVRANAASSKGSPISSLAPLELKNPPPLGLTALIRVSRGHCANQSYWKSQSGSFELSKSEFRAFATSWCGGMVKGFRVSHFDPEKRKYLAMIFCAWICSQKHFRARSTIDAKCRKPGACAESTACDCSPAIFPCNPFCAHLQFFACLGICMHANIKDMLFL